MYLTEDELLKIAMENILYQVITGSTSYGLNNEHSDVDEKAVTQFPKKYFYTLGKEFQTLSLHEPKDFEIHALKKFFTLLTNGNPTITEMVWTSERFIVKNSKYGQMLRDNKQLFLHSGIYDSFAGYAKQQLMRIKGGLEKLTDVDKIEHLQFTVDQLIKSFHKKYTQASNGIILLNDVYTTDNGKQNIDLSIHYDNISLTQINGMLSEIHHTMTTYNKMGKRNQKSGEKLFKHAMHLLRLLISGTIGLETGIIPVFIEDEILRQYLLDVRNGKKTWDEIFEMVAIWQQRMNKAHEQTSLSPEVDEKKIQELYTDMMIDILAS